jgi:nitrate/nitrite transport system permease protein
MVAAVFHSPLVATGASASASAFATLKGAAYASNIRATSQNSTENGAETVATANSTTPPRYDWSALWLQVVPPILGLALLVGIWAMVSITSTNNFPSPWATAQQAVQVFSDPFYSKGPNDQGIGWNIWSSLKRVAVGFGLAALVGIPLGFAIGRFTFLSRMLNPLISLLRPVSPLAWLPIGLLVFKGAHPAAIWTIFICSIWPMVINTAVGRAARTARLHERSAGFEPIRMEDHHQNPLPRGVALHADGRAPGRGHSLAGHRGG